MSMSSVDWDSDAADTIEAPGTGGSVDSHHAADSYPDDIELADATVALMSYIIGINNNEPDNQMNWAVTYRELRDDIKVALDHACETQYCFSQRAGIAQARLDGQQHPWSWNASIVARA